MHRLIQYILRQKNILHHNNEGIDVCVVKDSGVGIELALDMLYAIVDQQTALYLSGGKTPRELYKRLAASELEGDKKFVPGAVGMVDERFGEPYHLRSNELMIKETQLLRYLQMLNIPFYPVLKTQTSREELAKAYDAKIRSLNAVFKKNIAILGIGSDGHTAGIAGDRKDFINPLFDSSQKHLLVSEFNDQEGMFKERARPLTTERSYGERVTMTLLGLSMMDILIVLVFGNDKREALELMFKNGSEEEIPARFYKRSDIAGKTILITDQSI